VPILTGEVIFLVALEAGGQLAEHCRLREGAFGKRRRLPWRPFTRTEDGMPLQDGIRVRVKGDAAGAMKNPHRRCGFGAGNETRTRDFNLGKVALYQLSYSRAALFKRDSNINSSIEKRKTATGNLP
jgi:hypothetical protein